jgi:hypothetical protein
LSRIAALLGLVLTGWGCQQPPYYYYYGYGAPACVPVVPAPAAPVNGSGGEPPTEIIEGGTSSVDAPARTTTVIGSQTPTRVVVSEPDNAPRGSWRRNPNPDAAIATSVEGGVSTSSESTVGR